MYAEEIIIGGNVAQAEQFVTDYNNEISERRLIAQQQARQEARRLQVANMTGNLLLKPQRRPGFVKD